MTAHIVTHREHPDPFVRFPRELLENPSLSFKAKGLLAWLLDKGEFPGGWETEVSRICSITSEGRDAVRATLAELELAGYLTRLGSAKGGRGQRMEWHVRDHSILSENPEVSVESERIIPFVEAEKASSAPHYRETSFSKTRDGVAKRRSQLPDDFKLNDERFSRALAAGMVSVEAEFEAFRNYHLAHGSVMANWDAAWRTWIGNSSKWGGAKHNGVAHVNGLHPDVAAALDKARASAP